MEKEMRASVRRAAVRIACILLALAGCVFIGFDMASGIANYYPGLQHAVYIAVFALSLIFGIISLGI